MKLLRMIITAATIAAAPATSTAAGAPANKAPTSQVVELRQYKIMEGKRDAFVALFEREFVDSQEADGMMLLGQFRDLDDPSRFVWIRGFPDLASRLKSLNDFYYGPVWKQHRDAANPMLEDNDNVLLLKPSGPASGLARRTRPAAVGEGSRGSSVVTATIYYLWKEPDEGFSAFFDAEVRPRLEAAGIEVLASFTPLAVENNFPRLPVRSGEKVFVWFSRHDDMASLSARLKRLHGSQAWKRQTEPALRRWLERAPQVLRLQPTPRSALR